MVLTDLPVVQVVVEAPVEDQTVAPRQVVLHKIILDLLNKVFLVVLDLLVNPEQETVEEVVVPVLLDKIALQELVLIQELEV